MAKFKLKANFQPTGDQPGAIKQLTDGLKAKERQQTLVGVTGSGKSLVSETPTLIRIDGKEEMVQVGPFIDKKFMDLHNFVVNVGDTEVINLFDLTRGHNFKLEVQSVNPNTHEQSWKPVYQLTRHKSPAWLSSVTLSNGRHVTVTNDHNFYVLRDGQLKLALTSDLKTGDVVPSARRLPKPKITIKTIKLWQVLDKQFYHAAIDIDKLNVKQKAIIKESLTYMLWYRFAVSRERLPLQAVAPMLDKHNWLRGYTRIGTKHRAHDLPAVFDIDDDFCRLVGLYVAEGHSAKQYLLLSNSEPDIVKWLKAYFKRQGITCNTRANTYDNVVYSKIYADLLRRLCGHYSHNKHFPNWWPRLPDKQLGIMTAWYYAGDGSVEKLVISASTASTVLASDLMYILLRFEITVRRRIKATGFRPANILSIYGAPAIKTFTNSVGMGCLRKQKLAEQLAKRTSARRANTNIDLVPTIGSVWKAMRLRLGLFQADITKSLGVNRSYISMIEAGLRSPSITIYTKMAGSFTELTLPNLHNLLWSEVETVKSVRGKGYVYDFAVEQNETFLAGDGGIFVHNTFTMANIIQDTQRPALILSHNKTLAAQLYSEFKSFFPDNAVHYFVSYFDYYQPEAYIPRSDTYIEKDSQINEEIDRLRHAATDSLLSRRDVIIVASVSCIYGIGSVEDYSGLSIKVSKDERKVRDKFLRQLTDIQYQRNDIDFHRSTFRVRGDVVDVYPASEELAYRMEFFGDQVERITQVDPLTGEILKELSEYRIFPGSHYVTPQEKLKLALVDIENELKARLKQFRAEGKLLEAQRLEQRTRFDLEMLEETGFVKGIENYSRYLTNREVGEQPATLLDYFPDDFLMFVDESHMTMPQVRGMYNGDRARKEVLVEHGFRLPSALDNRPLTFSEFEKHVNQVIYVSATPAEYELSRSPKPAQQLIRPTGLLDPVIEVKPIEGQIDDLINEIKTTVDKHQRVLVTTLTKRMSEDLAEYLQEINIKVAYLHSDIDTLERSDILRDLRLGIYDVLVGINLLREGLDLPEVSLVAILDADKEGFLRSTQALTQTAGRAARHEEGRVIMYADHQTDSMKRTIDETNRRRQLQQAYNQKHHITPKGIKRQVGKGLRPDLPEEAKRAKLELNKIPKEEYGSLLKDLNSQMELAAANLQFETAAELRDLINEIKAKV